MVMEKYINFISLGYFCGVAQDLEALGLRDASYPFDWCISNYEGVIKAIDNRFSDFMAYENLSQSAETRKHYMDTAYEIFFFHDFSQYKSLDEQYFLVKEKYRRRINRFLKRIEQPTCFVRYIANESTWGGTARSYIG